MSVPNIEVEDEGNKKDVELSYLHPESEKRTRFQVNRVRNESHNSHNCSDVRIEINGEQANSDYDDNDDDIHSVSDRTRLNSEYAKSFR